MPPKGSRKETWTQELNFRRMNWNRNEDNSEIGFDHQRGICTTGTLRKAQRLFVFAVEEHGSVRRFVGRRGPVVELYCDNATNFVGAARILKELLEPVDTNDQSIMSYTAAHRFTIEFIPPRAPHIGGLWEAAVKSAKHHLLKAMGSAILTEDELHTVIVDVEAVLNSRPLIVDSGSPNEGEVVTPADLLVGTTLETLPPASAQPKANGNLSYLQRWQLVSAIKQRFWNDWSRDYLLSLQQRGKWTKDVDNLQIGTVVAIHEDNFPLQLWLIGVVVEGVSGHD
ncbi:uncharacterized protein LOC123037285 [Drosophila rhopaloa]|uniref:DUF5641 domain-containing protein n=1 Tax=Drosophila rhopaloa TaxID=1041015 RepID=A0ABM5J385_DRORH|nr:uncharacterized protein LOC123037285 [Drosophila rhopaloa]